MHPSPVLQRAIRRLALTTKQGPHNFYKGNRTGALGRHTIYGGYKLDYKRVRTYVCPDLSTFELTPFVTRRIEAIRESFRHTETGLAIDGKEYLRKWKEAGGEDPGAWAPRETVAWRQKPAKRLLTDGAAQITETTRWGMLSYGMGGLEAEGMSRGLDSASILGEHDCDRRM